ncbi:MAG: hypothetical protein DIU52_000180 [bacterium]|jgi:gas vesicle protein|nr:MAG: hypothetical protein DIU52_06905 [bacterium]
MAQHGARDFVAAFAVGAALGVGAALLLRPEPPTRTERLLRELTPYRKRLRKHVRRASRRLRGRGDELKDEMLAIGRDFLRDLRAEANEIVAQARAELVRAVEDEVARTRRERRRAQAEA